jgi:predicted DNA binding protein
MSVIVDVTVPADDFTLGAALSANPGIRLSLERIIPIGNTFVPYLWASNEDLDEIKEAFTQETDVESFIVADTVNDEALIRVDWAEGVDGLLEAMIETSAAVLEGNGEADTWHFQLRFDSHEALSDFYQRCVDAGVRLDIESVHNPGITSDLTIRYDLTDEQRKTLQLALDEGYFAVPRGINLTELAEKLGISDSAVSQRLRRAITTVLIESKLGE